MKIELQTVLCGEPNMEELIKKDIAKMDKILDRMDKRFYSIEEQQEKRHQAEKRGRFTEIKKH